MITRSRSVSVMQRVEEHLTMRQLQDRLHLSLRTVQRLISGGSISPVVKVGRALRIPASSVNTFLEDRRR